MNRNCHCVRRICSVIPSLSTDRMEFFFFFLMGKMSEYEAGGAPRTSSQPSTSAFTLCGCRGLCSRGLTLMCSPYKDGRQVIQILNDKGSDLPRIPSHLLESRLKPHHCTKTFQIAQSENLSSSDRLVLHCVPALYMAYSAL